MLIPPVVSENIHGQKSTGEEKEEDEELATAITKGLPCSPT
jgi:hypothetical protein